MITLGLIGASGKWAQNYIKTIDNFSNIKLLTANRDTWQDLINSKTCNGIIISTPPDTHINIAEIALKNNIPVMIEKPLSLSFNEAQQLKQYNIPILVNHIHLFSQSYQNLKNIVKNKKIDKIVSLGFNKGPIRTYSSLWDYGCHDLSMILDILQEMPSKIEIQEIKSENTSLFFLEMNFKNCQTQSLVGNGGKKAIRKLKINCEGLKLIYDDKDRPIYHNPPLTNAIQVFLDAIHGKEDERLGINLSLNVIKTLEKYQNLLDNKI